MNIYCFSTLSFAKLQFKSVINKAFHKHGVASFTDAWIETALTAPQQGVAPVASFTDAWIETGTFAKLRYMIKVASFTDAWIETVTEVSDKILGQVASFTDAWIETKKEGEVASLNMSHLLQMRGLKQCQTFGK